MAPRPSMTPPWRAVLAQAGLVIAMTAFAAQAEPAGTHCPAGTARQAQLAAGDDFERTAFLDSGTLAALRRAGLRDAAQMPAEPDAALLMFRRGGERAAILYLRRGCVIRTVPSIKVADLLMALRKMVGPAI